MAESTLCRPEVTCKRMAAGAVLGLTALSSQAQYESVPQPSFRPPAAQVESSDASSFKLEVARHLYATYSGHIYRGVMPPMLNAVMITETRIDPTGQVIDVEIRREPAQDKEAIPWVKSLIKAASPFPAPVNFGPHGAVVRDIWLIHRSVQGRSAKFQLDSLSEGQKGTPPSCSSGASTVTEASAASGATIVAAGSDKVATHWPVFSVEERAQGAGYALARNQLSIERVERGIPALGQETEVKGPLGTTAILGEFKTTLKWEAQSDRTARYVFNNSVLVSGSAREASELKERDLPASASYLRIVAKTPLQLTFSSTGYNATGSGEAFLMQLREATDPCTHVQSLEIQKRTAFPAKKPIRHVLILPVGEHRLAWGVGIKRSGGTVDWAGALEVEPQPAPPLPAAKPDSKANARPSAKPTKPATKPA